ncbi:MAG: HD-GYP domain-containing protein [Bacillota bacterium]
MSKQVSFFLAGLILSLSLPLALYIWLKQNPHLDHAVQAPAGHFQVVSAAALLAALVAIAVGVAGRRLRNIQVTLLAMAFTSLSLIFSLHGLATPGFLLPPSQLPPMAAQLSVLVTAFWLWLSSRPGDHPLVGWMARRQGWLVQGWALLLVVAVGLLMWKPSLVSLIPVHSSPLKWAAMAVSLSFTLLAARHYWTAYRYSRLPLQAAILHSSAWLAAAQVIITTGVLWHLSWWLYHFLLLGSMLMMIVGLLAQYASGASLVAAVRGLFATDPVERIEAGVAPSIRRLVIETERHDPYTAGHSYRVALYALQLGQGMGLPPEKLRALAQGAIAHDIGKINLPGAILNKPGRLTPEERAVIEQHPSSGHTMAKLLGFMQDELDIIRHHHERYDGTGYPDRLAGEQIPLLARILAVADVYDALTSNRSYRQAWSHEQAMALIREGAGTQFDPACVAAWTRVMPEAPQVDRYPAWLPEASKAIAVGSV